MAYPPSHFYQAEVSGANRKLHRSAAERVMVTGLAVLQRLPLGAVSTRVDLEKVVKRFPEYGALIRRLVLRDKSFRELCEDYLAACSSFAWFQAANKTGPEVADFELLMRQLEEEIADRLNGSQQ
jgi:hypothetical protein